MAIDTDTNFRRDLSALAGHEDVATTTALTKIARDANGGKDTPVAHANDKSYDELVAEYKGVGANKAEVVDIVAEGGHVGMAVVGLGEEALLIGGAAAIAGPIAALGAGMYELAEANHRGQELHTALTRDEQRVALLTNTALPEGFVKQELTKYSHAGTRFDSGAQQLTTQIRGQDHALGALLQLHTDQGMNAAHDMQSLGQDKAAFFAAHPGLAQRYANDIAFKNGFDAMSWAKDQGGATYERTVADLQKRDGWYASAGVAMRG